MWLVSQQAPVLVEVELPSAAGVEEPVFLYAAVASMPASRNKI